MGGQRNAPAALHPPPKKPGTNCIGGWVSPNAGLDGYEKFRPPPEFDPRTVQPVASRYTGPRYKRVWLVSEPCFSKHVQC